LLRESELGNSDIRKLVEQGKTAETICSYLSQGDSLETPQSHDFPGFRGPSVTRRSKSGTKVSDDKD
jgi:hypothetical protein